MSLQITGTDFVLMLATDLERTRRFYTETLGLAYGKPWGDVGFEVETGSLTLAFMRPDAMGREFSPSATSVALHVEDFESAKAELEARGVEFQTDVIDSGVCKQAYFADPDGNPLGIHERYKAAS